MSVDYSVDSLIATVKRIATVPTSQKLFNDDRFVGILNDELQGILVPHIMSVREEYFVDYVEYTVAPHTNDYRIEIPADAIGGKLREVAWVDVNGRLIKLARVDLEIQDGVQTNYIVSGFRVENNDVVLNPSQGGTLRIYYFKRPAELIKTSQCAKVVAVNGLDIQVDSTLPTTWVNGIKLNTIGINQPFKTKGVVTIISSSFPIVTVDNVDDVTVGDWICLEGYSPIPQIPVEAHKVLAQMAAVKCLEALGDDKVGVAEKKAQSMLEALMKIINPRVDASPKRLVGSGIGDWMKYGVGRRW